MRTYAYAVQQFGPRSLSELTRRVFELELHGRSFGGDASLRLEDRAEDGDFLLLDFAKQRSGHGPARYSRELPLAAFDMKAGEGFGEDTSMLCHVPTNTVALQYNHHGPKITRIQDYLFSADLSLGIGPAVEGILDADRCGVRFGAVLTRNALERLRRFGVYRQVEFAIALPGVQAGDIQQGVGLGAALRAPLPGGVEHITMSIGATTQKGSHLDHGGTAQFINDLMALGPALQRAFVKGKPTEEEKTERVDLVEERVKSDEPIDLAAGGRYSRDDRWEALRRSWRRWHDAGLLPL